MVCFDNNGDCINCQWSLIASWFSWKNGKKTWFYKYECDCCEDTMTSKNKYN